MFRYMTELRARIVRFISQRVRLYCDAAMMRFKRVDGGYIDSDTGLVWREQDETGIYTQKEAMRLSEGDWRLPTIGESMKIIDNTLAYGTAKTRLPRMRPSYYWTSSPDILDRAWYVHFGTGYSNHYDRGYKHYVRLVRDSGESNEQI